MGAVARVEAIENEHVRDWYVRFEQEAVRCYNEDDMNGLGHMVCMLGVMPPDADFDALFGDKYWREDPALAFSADHQAELNAIARQILIDAELLEPLGEYLRQHGPADIFTPEYWTWWWNWASRVFFASPRPPQAQLRVCR